MPSLKNNFLRIALIIILMSFALWGASAAWAFGWDSCRRVSGPCPYPGLCHSYYDSNGNGICDLSEPAPAPQPEAQPAPADTAQVSAPPVATAPQANDEQKTLAAATPAPAETLPDMANDSLPVSLELEEHTSFNQGDGQEETALPVNPVPAPVVSAETPVQSINAQLLPLLGLFLLLLAASLHKLIFRQPWLRWLLLGAGLVYLGFYSKCFLCPVGAFTAIVQLASGKITSYLLLGLLLLPVIFTILFGRIYCGSVCPMGAAQDFLTLLGKNCGWR